MKKIFAAIIISTFVILPTFAAAQTTSGSDNSALIAVLEQLVQVLNQEIQQILAQQQQQTQLQQQLVQNQNTQSQQIQQIAQNTQITAQNTTPTPTSTGTTNSNTANTSSAPTIQAGTLNISATSIPALSIAPSTQYYTFANIKLDASQSDEGVKIASLPIIVDTTGANSNASDLSNCQLYNGVTALNTGTNVVNSTNWTTVTTNAQYEANFLFNSPLTIPKGTAMTLALECSVSSNPVSTAYAVGVSSSYPTTTTGVQTGDTITPMVQSGTSGTMTLGNVSLTVTDPSPTSLQQVTGNTTGNTVGTFTLEPKSDSVNLQQVGLSLNATDASSTDVLRAYVYEGWSAQVGSVIFSSPPINGYYYATSTISSLNLPENQPTTFMIKADTAPIGAGQATVGHEILINLTDAHGTGASSGTVVDSGPLSTLQAGVVLQQ